MAMYLFYLCISICLPKAVGIYRIFLKTNWCENTSCASEDRNENTESLHVIITGISGTSTARFRILYYTQYML